MKRPKVEPPVTNYLLRVLDRERARAVMGEHGARLSALAQWEAESVRDWLEWLLGESIHTDPFKREREKMKPARVSGGKPVRRRMRVSKWGRTP